MNADIAPWLDPFNTSLSVLLFLVGLFCLLTRRNVIKQVRLNRPWPLAISQHPKER